MFLFFTIKQYKYCYFLHFLKNSIINHNNHKEQHRTTEKRKTRWIGMALIMKDGKEVRVPGRAISAERCKPAEVVFEKDRIRLRVDFRHNRLLDSMSFREFRKEDPVAQIVELAKAREEKALVAEDSGDASLAFHFAIKAARGIEDACKMMVERKHQEHEDFKTKGFVAMSIVSLLDFHFKIGELWRYAHWLATSKEDKAKSKEKKDFFDRMWVLLRTMEKLPEFDRESLTRAEKIELMRMTVRMGEIVGPEFSKYSDFDIDRIKAKIGDLERTRD
jgi:hypothetical protein